MFIQRFFTERPGKYWDEMEEIYGSTFDMRIFGLPSIFTKDPNFVKHMLTGDSFTNFEKGEWFNGMFADFLGNGIFNSDREMWKDLARRSRHHRIYARDTTASTLSSAIYMLARNPGILKRLREQIVAGVGREETPTYESARSLVYLRAFINEVLRMYPAVPFNVRASINEDVFVAETGKPLYIPPRVRISYGIFNLQRRPDLWGTDASTFDPDRWLDERISLYKKNPFIWTPFSAGPRLCLGQQFGANLPRNLRYQPTD
ncbi:hypothetical protein P7C70_g7375, partial [Phenoliferia sp. Uapishka_3]